MDVAPAASRGSAVYTQEEAAVAIVVYLASNSLGKFVHSFDTLIQSNASRLLTSRCGQLLEHRSLSSGSAPLSSSYRFGWYCVLAVGRELQSPARSAAKATTAGDTQEVGAQESYKAGKLCLDRVVYDSG